jgi:hypothetical protein
MIDQRKKIGKGDEVGNQDTKKRHFITLLNGLFFLFQEYM